MIIPINATTNSGWKVDDPGNFCSKENLQLCFENISYSYSEIVLNTSHRVETDSFFVSKYAGLVHTIYPPPGAVKTFHRKSFKITLNTNFRYKIAISDPHFTLMTPNPITFPRTLLEVEPFAGKTLVYLEVSWELIWFWTTETIPGDRAREPRHQQPPVRGRGGLQAGLVFEEDQWRGGRVPNILDQHNRATTAPVPELLQNTAEPQEL